MELRRIDVGMDLSEGADAALAHACRLARARGARIRMVHVSPPLRPDSDMHEPTIAQHVHDLAEKDRERVRAELGRRALDLRAADIDIDSELITGKPAPALAEAAEAASTDLLVVGTHGRTGARRFLLGSVAEKVARLAPCDVLVARGDAPNGESYRRIAVATDFGEPAEAAIERVALVAGLETRVRVVHCWQLPALASESLRMSLDTDIRSAVAAEVEERGQAVAKRLQDRGYRAEFVALEASPADGIAQLLEDEPVDLVIVGTHGRRGVKRWLLGSVAELTVRHAACPVWVARQPAPR